MKNQLSSWRLNILLLIASLLIVFICSELITRTCNLVNGYGFFSNHLSLINKKIKPMLPFRTFGFELYRKVDGIKYISSRHKELFPIIKPKGTFRIVVFGGSTSENFISFKIAKIHYPLLLQSELRRRLNTKAIEVINVAKAGYSTAHSLILFELDVLSWDPDLIIVSHNFNDLSASYWPEFTFDYSGKYSHKFFYVPDYKSIFSIPNVLFKHSAFYWFVRNRIDSLKTEENKKIKRASYGNAPAESAIQVFKRNLRSITAIAKENGIKVLFGNQPILPKERYFIKHISNKPYNSIVTYPLHEEFLHHHKTFNEAIKQVAEETGVFFIDNESVLGTRGKYFFDFLHYTTSGVTLLANNYANCLIKQDIIKLR
jgi:hypothetical protein